LFRSVGVSAILSVSRISEAQDNCQANHQQSFNFTLTVTQILTQFSANSTHLFDTQFKDTFGNLPNLLNQPKIPAGRKLHPKHAFFYLLYPEKEIIVIL